MNCYRSAMQYTHCFKVIYTPFIVKILLSSSLFCLALMIQVTVRAEENTIPGQPPLFPVTTDKKFPDARTTYDEARQLILENYYTNTISEDALYQASIKGMLRHISPPQTPELAALWPPETYKQIRTSLKGMDVSLGVNLTYNVGDGSLTVNSIQSGSPAEGHLMAHDRIMRINGKKLSGQSADTIKSMLNGKPGSKIHLTVIRDIQVFNLELTLQKFQIKQVHSEAIGNKVGYIRLNSFSQDIHQE
ncbi:MAG: PDZ domain-containing protein, partial [Gammaproteobacteria bacterium]